MRTENRYEWRWQLLRTGMFNLQKCRPKCSPISLELQADKYFVESTLFKDFSWGISRRILIGAKIHLDAGGASKPGKGKEGCGFYFLSPKGYSFTWYVRGYRWLPFRDRNIVLMWHKFELILVEHTKVLRSFCKDCSGLACLARKRGHVRETDYKFAIRELCN